MEKYTYKILKEGFEKKTDAEKEEEVKDAIEMLKDESFGNAEQRKKMAKVMYKICNSKDGDAKKFVSEIGKVMSNWGEGNFDKAEKEEEK